jgi:hypothetical protein
MTKQQIKRRIERCIGILAKVQQKAVTGLVPQSLTDGKLYEAHVLTCLLEKMVTQEGLTITFRPGKGQKLPRVKLRSKGGALSDAFPHFDLSRNGSAFGELWTDIEFLTFSFVQSGRQSLTPGDFHELDLMIVQPATRGRPRPKQILLGVECKNTPYGKDFLRQILGVRRELSLLQQNKRTAFNAWPQTRVPAEPASCLVVYATDSNVMNFSEPGKMFGIHFQHEPL